MKINNIEEYQAYAEKKIEIPSLLQWIEYTKVDFNIKFNVGVLESFHSKRKEKILADEKINEERKQELIKKLSSEESNHSFKDCNFYKDFKLPNYFDGNFEFENCVFHQSFDLSDGKLGGKFKFYNCTFSDTGFSNTTFKDLADFYNCTFEKKTLFYKTDFLGTTVFSATTFKENALFTYSLIDKLIIFRGTKFEAGLDLSCAILAGEMNPFDIRLGDFKPEIIKEKGEKTFEEEYDQCITKKGLIPIKNQRETYRILKEAFIKREDIASSIKYKVLEKETLRKELKTVRYSPTALAKKYPDLDKKLFQIENWFEKLNLLLNKWSNNYGKSYSRALGLIFVIGGFIFYFTSIASNKYNWCGFSWQAMGSGIGDFFTFLLPIHGFDYLGPVKDQGGLFFFLDFIGRVVIGYLIYQLITAFRKYR